MRHAITLTMKYVVETPRPILKLYILYESGDTYWRKSTSLKFIKQGFIFYATIIKNICICNI